MSKISRILILGFSLGLSQAAMAITNAELARLNNELIGLDAQLAVAKKKSELEKYRSTGVPPQTVQENTAQKVPARQDPLTDAEPNPTRKSKREAAGDLQGTASQETIKSSGRKSTSQ